MWEFLLDEELGVASRLKTADTEIYPSFNIMQVHILLFKKLGHIVDLYDMTFRIC